MPRVTTGYEAGLGNSQVAPQRGGLSVQSSPADFGAIQGVQQERLGNALLQVSTIPVAVASIEQRQRNIARAEDAFAHASDRSRVLLHDPQGGVFSLQGSNALGATETTTKQFDDIGRDTSAALENDAQKAMFARRWDVHRNASLEAVSNHETQQFQVYRKEATKGAVTSAILNATDAYTDPNIKKASQAIIENAIRSGNPGAPPEYVDSLIRTANLEMDDSIGKRQVQVVDQWIASDPRRIAAGLGGGEGLWGALERFGEASGPTSVSPAGAMGVSQLMPGTAREAARDLGITAVAGMSDADLKARLTSNKPEDIAFNRMLGQSYLNKMLERYNGNRTLALAAYNAGSDRVNDWIARNGDPRTPQISEEEWAAKIPFRETREYIPRVLAHAAPGIDVPADKRRELLTRANAGIAAQDREIASEFTGYAQDLAQGIVPAGYNDLEQRAIQAGSRVAPLIQAGRARAGEVEQFTAQPLPAQMQQIAAADEAAQQGKLSPEEMDQWRLRAKATDAMQKAAADDPLAAYQRRMGLTHTSDLNVQDPASVQERVRLTREASSYYGGAAVSPLTKGEATQLAQGIVGEADPMQRAARLGQLVTALPLEMRQPALTAIEKQRGGLGNIPDGGLARLGEIAAVDPPRAAQLMTMLSQEAPNSVASEQGSINTAMHDTMQVGPQSIALEQYKATGNGDAMAIWRRDNLLVERLSKTLVASGQASASSAPSMAAEMLYKDTPTLIKNNAKVRLPPQWSTADVQAFDAGLTALTQDKIATGVQTPAPDLAALPPEKRDAAQQAYLRQSELAQRYLSDGVWVNGLPNSVDLVIPGLPVGLQQAAVRLSFDEVRAAGQAALAQRSARAAAAGAAGEAAAAAGMGVRGPRLPTQEDVGNSVPYMVPQ